MATVVDIREKKPRELSTFTRAEAHDLFDRTAQRYLGISGKQFLKNWDANVYATNDHKCQQIMRVAMLIPLVRKERAGKTSSRMR